MFGLRGKSDLETALLRALDKRDPKALQRLLETHGPNATDRDGRTLLANAASRGDVEITRLALDLGSAPDRADGKGLTALHFAVMGTHLALTDLLLANGANVDPRDSWGNTPLNRAVPLPGHPDAEAVVRLLLAKRADPRAANHSGVSPASWIKDFPALGTLLGISA